MILNQIETPESDEAESMLPTLDAILARATDAWGPVTVVAMLRDKADCIEAISNRRMH